MNYFIIPGNPPALYFYQEWQKEIKAWQPQAHVFVSEYPLLSTRHLVYQQHRSRFATTSLNRTV